MIAKARGGGRYTKVRWWGEMVNVLWERGDVAASMDLEDQFHRLAHEHEIAIFCSFVMDNFNGEVHSRMLPRLGQNHSHLIPVEDYARLERAVADALRETVGADEARVLEEQLSPAPRLHFRCRVLRRCCSPCVRPSGCGGLCADPKPETLPRHDGLSSNDAIRTRVSARRAMRTTPPVRIRPARHCHHSRYHRCTHRCRRSRLHVEPHQPCGGGGVRPRTIDIGRRLGAVAALAGVKDIEQLCAQVISDYAASRHDIRSGDRRFLLRIAPYAIGPGQTAGAVLTFTNVTAFRASIEQAIYEREYTKAILNTITSPLVVLDSNLRVQSGNRAFYSMFGISREKAQGIALQSLGDDDWKVSGLWAALNAIVSESRDFQSLEIERDFPLTGRRASCSMRAESRSRWRWRCHDSPCGTGHYRAETNRRGTPDRRPA